MKILITGNAGLLGSQLANWIIENHPESTILGIDDFSGGYIENVNSKVQQFYSNILYPNGLDNLNYIFRQHKFDYVFHFAAYAAECLSPFIRKYNYENNLIGTTNIVNNCIKHGVKRLIFTSSLAVYGKDGEMDETDTPNPKDPYGVAKLACEQDIRIAGEQHGLDWCVLRPHNIYGPNQNIWDKYRNLMGIFMYQKLNNLPLTIYGDGKQTRQFSYIEDILSPLWQSAINPRASKQIINLGGTKEYSVNDVAQSLIEIFGPTEIKYLESRHEVKHALTTWQKSVDILGYKDITPLGLGLHKMWKWAQKQPKREQFVWPYYELDKGMYSYWKLDK